MQKRTFLLIMFAVLFGIGTLLAAGNAAAQGECDPPLSCTTDNGWSVELMGGAPVPVDGGYKWRYLIKKQNLEDLQSFQSMDYVDCEDPPTGLQYFNLSIPVCCPDPVIIGDSDPTVHIRWPPGTPGGWGFGAGILQSYVIKWYLENSPQELEVWFVTNSINSAKGTAGLVIDGGVGLKTCEIAVPGCPTFALAAVAKENYVSTADGREFKQILDPFTQCPTEIYELVPCISRQACRRNGDCTPCKSETYEWLLDKKPSDQVLTAEHGDGTAAEGVVFVGNPGDDCGGAILKSDSDNSWFFCFLGWCWF